MMMGEERRLPGNPTSAMIIPTRAGSAGVDADTLRRRWEGQTWLPDELIIVRGARRPSLARNRGASETKADILIVTDDDGVPASENVLEGIVTALFDNDSVWLSGAAIILPPNASSFQRRYAGQIPLNTVEIPMETTESDLVTTLCCAIRRERFESVGGFDERLTAGEDPEFRDRVRAHGGRMVLAQGTAVHHPPPKNLYQLVRRGIWYGRGNAQRLKISTHTGNVRWRGLRILTATLLKAIFAPTCLILDWESLREWRLKYRFAPLRMLHVWAVAVGFLQYTLREPQQSQGNENPVIGKYRFNRSQPE